MTCPRPRHLAALVLAVALTAVPASFALAAGGGGSDSATNTALPTYASAEADVNAGRYQQAIKSLKSLVKADPANADAYAANADAYKKKIEAAIAPIRARLEKLSGNRRWLVTSEGAFSYLARDFGLQELYLWMPQR